MTLRVLHVNGERTWRGGERQLYLQLKHSASGIQNHVLCKRGSTLSKRIEGLGAKVHFARLRNGLDLLSTWRLLQICRKHSIDIVHCHTPKTHALGALSKLLGNGAELIVTKRTVFPISRNFFSRWKYRQARLTICVSEGVRQVVEQSLTSASTIVISSGIELFDTAAEIKTRDFSPTLHGRKKIGYVAAMTKEKDPDTFLEVAARTISLRDDVIFVWVGDGHLKPTIEQRISEDGLQDRILLPGFQEDILSWIGNLDILFFPSKAEGFPTTILDAMQCGIPVVASNIRGIQAIIESGQDGLLASPGDIRGFMNQIEWLLEDPVKRQKVIANARERAKAFDIKYLVQRIEQAYTNILSKRRS